MVMLLMSAECKIFDRFNGQKKEKQLLLDFK